MLQNVLQTTKFTDNNLNQNNEQQQQHIHGAFLSFNLIYLRDSDPLLERSEMLKRKEKNMSLYLDVKNCPFCGYKNIVFYLITAIFPTCTWCPRLRLKTFLRHRGTQISSSGYCLPLPHDSWWSQISLTPRVLWLLKEQEWYQHLLFISAINLYIPKSPSHYTWFEQWHSSICKLNLQ